MFVLGTLDLGLFLAMKDTKLKTSVDLLFQERWVERKTRSSKMAVLKINCVNESPFGVIL